MVKPGGTTRKDRDCRCLWHQAAKDSEKVRLHFCVGSPLFWLFVWGVRKGRGSGGHICVVHCPFWSRWAREVRIKRDWIDLMFWNRSHLFRGVMPPKESTARDRSRTQRASTGTAPAWTTAAFMEGYSSTRLWRVAAAEGRGG